jgi:hypothetical protein
MATLPALRPSYTSWTAPGSDGIPGSLRPAPPPQLPPKVLPTTSVSTAGATDAKIVRKGLERAGYGAGRVASASLRAAPAVGVLTSFRDYGIDDPSVDSSAGGTLRALRQGNLGDAGRSLSKGALETGMDLGSSAAKVADILPGVDASGAYNRLLRSTFGDQLIDRTGRTDAPAQAASGPLRASQALPQGMTPSTAVQGRGGASYAALDPRRTDINPADIRLGASRDFTNELNAVPADLPGGMRPGVIIKTEDANGNVTYSGSNVKAGAMMVDGPGRTLRQDGAVTTFNGGTGLAGGYGGTAAPAGPSGFDRGTAGGVGDLGVGYSARLRDQNDLTAASSITLRPEERMAMRENVDQRQQLRMKEEGEMGRAQLTANVSLRNNERNANVAMRGQDLELQGRILPAQQKMLYERQMAVMKGQLLQRAGGDYRAAALMADQLGLPFGEDFRKAVTENQAVARGRVDNAGKMFEGQVIGPDGKPDKAAETRALQLAQSETGGAFGDADVAQQAAELPERLRRARLLESANARRNPLPWNKTPAFSNLPSAAALDTAEYEQVGMLEGAFMPGREWGDHRLRLRDGTTMIFGQDVVDQAGLKTTLRQGAKQ